MSKENINLPKTSFSMKANLPNKEPEILKIWEKLIYIKNLENLEKEKRNLFYMTGLHMQMATFIWVRL